MFNKSIDTTTTLCLTVFYPLLYSPYTRILVYVLHSRPTFIVSTAQLRPSLGRIRSIDQNNNGPVEDLFSCLTHHLTSPPPSPHHHYHCHHHCHSHAFSGCSIHRLQSHYSTSHPVARAFLSLSLSISRRHSLRRTHSLYYVPVTRNPYPQPYRLNPSKKMWWCGVLQRWCVEELKLKETTSRNQFVFLGFIIIIIRLNLLPFFSFTLSGCRYTVERWRVGMGWDGAMVHG